MKNTIVNELKSHLEIINKVIGLSDDDIYNASKIIVKILKSGNKILICGNGGSAADAQHFAAELTGRYKTERQGLPAISLATDTSALTAIGNDYGYDRVFDRQVEALANKNDLIIGISTSGNSKNVLGALSLGKKMGCSTLGLTGRKGGKMNNFCDINIIVPSDNTPRIQEMHILFIHIICQIIDNEFIGSK